MEQQGCELKITQNLHNEMRLLIVATLYIHYIEMQPEISLDSIRVMIKNNLLYPITLLQIPSFHLLSVLTENF